MKYRRIILIVLVIIGIIQSGYLFANSESDKVNSEKSSPVEVKKELMQNIDKRISIEGIIKYTKVLSIDFKGVLIYFMSNANEKSDALKYEEIGKNENQVMNVSGILHYSEPMTEAEIKQLNPLVQYFHPDFYFDVKDVSINMDKKNIKKGK